MAIAKPISRAPCPIFAGRGLEKNGFTLALNKKTYLTSDQTNIDSERGLLSVFNYDLAEAVYNDADDRVGFLVYIKAGAYANTIVTAKTMHALDVLMECDYEYTPTNDDRNAYCRGARLQAYGKKNMDGGIMGAYINAQVQGGYTYTGTTSVGTFAGAIGAEIRTEAMGPGTTAVCKFVSLLLWGRYMAAVTGAVTMLQIEPPWRYATISGNLIGIEFTKGYKYTAASEPDFDIGIDLGDHCTTGIDIGTCTTGISFTGTVTDGIKFETGATVTTAINVADACSTAAITISGDTPIALNITSGVSAATAAIQVAGINAIALNITGANTTAAIEISSGTTIGLHIKTTVQADGILIASACTDGIHISGACATNAINISATTTIGIAISSAAADAIKISGDGTDAIEISGNNTYGINISDSQTAGFYYVSNMAVSEGAWVHGLKIELTRSADAEIASGAFYGAQIVINKGAQATTLAPNIYGLQVVVKGAATGGNCYGFQVETQSSGEVDYLAHVRLNTGTTLASGGAMLYLQTYVTTAKALKIEVLAAVTMTSSISIEDNAGTGTITNLISVDCENTTYFLADAAGDAGFLAGVTTHDTESDEIACNIGGTVKYIKLYT